MAIRWASEANTALSQLHPRTRDVIQRAIDRWASEHGHHLERGLIRVTTPNESFWVKVSVQPTLDGVDVLSIVRKRSASPAEPAARQTHVTSGVSHHAPLEAEEPAEGPQTTPTPPERSIQETLPAPPRSATPTELGNTPAAVSFTDALDGKTGHHTDAPRPDPPTGSVWDAFDGVSPPPLAHATVAGQQLQVIGRTRGSPESPLQGLVGVASSVLDEPARTSARSDASAADERIGTSDDGCDQKADGLATAERDVVTPHPLPFAQAIEEEVDRALRLEECDPSTCAKIGPYRLLDKAGHGGFGDVWRAEDSRTGTTAAVKLFRRNRFDAGDQRAAAIRFWSGAAAMRKLSSSKLVVQLFDGPCRTVGTLWFSMEYHQRRDVQRGLGPQGLSFDDRVRVVNDLLAAVQWAHGHQVRHRDIRPANILLRDAATDGDSLAVLTDFDIAYFEPLLRSKTLTKIALGVDRYLPPEVHRAGEDDLAPILRRWENDYYAIAVVIFDLFAGPGASIKSRPRDLRAALMKGPVKMQRGFVSSLARFIAAGTHHDESQRFRSLDELTEAWRSTTRRGFGPSLVGAGLLAFALGAVLFLDYVWHAYADYQAIRFVGSVLASVGFLVALSGGIGGLVFSLPGMRNSKPWRWAVAQPLWAHITFFALCAVALACTFVSTDLVGRQHTVRVRGAIECQALDAQNEVLFVVESNGARLLDTAVVRTLACAGIVPPNILKQSFLTTDIAVIESKVEAGVAPGEPSPTKVGASASAVVDVQPGFGKCPPLGPFPKGGGVLRVSTRLHRSQADKDKERLQNVLREAGREDWVKWVEVAKGQWPVDGILREVHFTYINRVKSVAESVCPWARCQGVEPQLAPCEMRRN